MKSKSNIQKYHLKINCVWNLFVFIYQIINITSIYFWDNFFEKFQLNIVLSSFSEQAIQSIIVFEEAKRKCLCPECKTLQRENTNEYQEITDANSYQHPFEKVNS